MSVYQRRQIFQPNCPNLSNYYACDFGSRFVGCCQNEPCESGCTDVQPASFNKERFGDIPGALCPGGSLWYVLQCEISFPYACKSIESQKMFVR